MPDCPLCDRNLIGWGGVQQHLQSKHPDFRCTQCRQSFASTTAKQQHVADSPNHHVCGRCSHEPDFLSEKELNEHNVVEHNMCETCRRHFDSASDLTHHLRTHAEKTVECPGCPQMFTSSSAMVLHLESGTCESGAERERISDIAYELYQSGWYQGGDDPWHDFHCPTCHADFLYMSGLLQHAESEACGQNLDREKPLGKFLHYLRKQLGREK